MLDIILTNDTEETIEDYYYDLIKNAIEGLTDFMGLDGEIQLSVTLVDGKTIQELNKNYRQVDKVTDVLSFPMDFVLDQEIDFPVKMLGDIVINIEKIKEQAVEFNHSEERELTYLTVHSMLHLLGYDHIEEDQRLEMRSKEKEIMDHLGIGR